MTLVAVFGLLLLATLGCGSRNGNGANTNDDAITTTSSDARKVRLQLNWLSDAQHGGFYAALAEGHYAAVGLDVEIMPGGPGTAVLPKLAMGRCEFAVANADQVLLARAQDADVVAVFAAMQNSPRCILVHNDSGISSLDQLQNLTLALGDGKAFAEYLKKHVPLTNVRIVSYTGTVAKFLLDKNFAQQGYVFSEPILIAAQGGDARALMVSETGFNPYSSLVVVRQKTLDADREIVDRFVRATRLGWQSYLASPTSGNEAIAKSNTAMDLETLATSATAIAPLCRPERFEDELGSMKPERWNVLRDQLIQIKLLPTSSETAENAFLNVRKDVQ